MLVIPGCKTWFACSGFNRVCFREVVIAATVLQVCSNCRDVFNECESYTWQTLSHDHCQLDRLAILHVTVL